MHLKDIQISKAFSSFRNRKVIFCYAFCYIQYGYMQHSYLILKAIQTYKIILVKQTYLNLNFIFVFSRYLKCLKVKVK